MTWPELAVLCVWLALFELMRWQRYEHKLRRLKWQNAWRWDLVKRLGQAVGDADKVRQIVEKAEADWSDFEP